MFVEQLKLIVCQNALTVNYCLRGRRDLCRPSDAFPIADAVAFP